MYEDYGDDQIFFPKGSTEAERVPSCSLCSAMFKQNSLMNKMRMISRSQGSLAPGDI